MFYPEGEQISFVIKHFDVADFTRRFLGKRRSQAFNSRCVTNHDIARDFPIMRFDDYSLACQL